MCGICGSVSPNVDKRKKQVRDMTDGLSHRGPDGVGTFSNNYVSLGMRRLAIIDISAGNQPLYNEDNSLVIIGNGEIYNYKELNSRLRRNGHKFSTGSDIETIVHLYEEYGKKCLEHLRGMFAFALYDKSRNLLFFARDRSGEKPFYYTFTNDAFVFSSELKSLLKYPGISKKVSPTAIDTYFHLNFVSEPNTIFENIHKLPKATYGVVDIATLSLTTRQYWNDTKIDATKSGDPTLAIQRSFSETVKLCMQSDVPVGLLLSGGIDSGSLLAMLSHHGFDNIRTFCVGYENSPKVDERAYASEIASYYGARHTDREISDQEVVSNFPYVVYANDDPIADISATALYGVSELAHNSGVKVLLNGLGGDELFWGYRWLVDALEENMKKQQHLTDSRVQLMRRIVAHKGSSVIYRSSFPFLSAVFGRADQAVFYDQRPQFRKARMFVQPLYSRSFSEEIDAEGVFGLFTVDDFAERRPDELSRIILSLLRKHWLVSSAIVEADRIGMHHSLEIRSPYLDHKLIETVYSHSRSLHGYNEGYKYYLKAIMKDTLPENVLTRKKFGFTPPVARWYYRLFNAYLHLLDDGFVSSMGLFKKGVLPMVRKTWIGTPFLWDQVYQLLVLEMWGRMYIYGESPETLVWRS